MLVILVGPSGSGKSTIEKILEAKHGFARIVSHTTRPPRPGEVNGVDYYFVSEEEFLAAPMAEQTLYDGRFYGVSIQELESKTAQGNAIVVCEPNGAQMVKKTIPDAVTIFLDVPPAVRRYRLVYDRGMTREKVEQRLHLDRQVFKDFKADYVVPNGGAIETAVKQILSIVQSEILPLENVPNAELFDRVSQTL